MENVGNYMWVNTDDYKLHVIHTASMKTVACVTLKNNTSKVIQLLHVPEWHVVLVLWDQAEIWCLHDEVNTFGVHFIGFLQLNTFNPIYNLCRVTLGSTTEVWATRKDKQVSILTETLSGCCESDVLNCVANNNSATACCNLITCLHLKTNSENSLVHVWITFDTGPHLMCWNGENKTQTHSVSLQSKG